ncbi:hypothetical protein GCM10009759_18110 [Kitasatospora saccharophila]|uniref:Lipoprotein n=1 Tax=Kitasatospora saccharophila TaxID=407973 RepID=A0ABN2WHA0_9ACTN
MRTRPARALLLAPLLLSLPSLLGACAGPHQYAEGTGTHGVTTAEAAGDWVGADGTRLAPQEDGTARIEHLDGKDYDFDEGWRLSGTGSWELDDRKSGQQLVLDLTARTSTDTRPAPTASPRVTLPSPARPGPTGAPYRWRFELDHDEQQRLVLFFSFGDPDAGNMNVLQRPTP